LTLAEDGAQAFTVTRLALAALASIGLAFGCGRSELTIPDGTGAQLDDASESRDSALLDSGPGTANGRDDAGVDAGDDAEDDVAAFADAPPEPDADLFSNPPPDASPTPGVDGSGGGVSCGPLTCGGCCTGSFCNIGSSTLACGTGGQPCVICGPEVSCGHGLCE
jgi:hypothetical protein